MAQNNETKSTADTLTVYKTITADGFLLNDGADISGKLVTNGKDLEVAQTVYVTDSAEGGVSSNSLKRPYLDGNGYYQEMVNNQEITSTYDDGTEYKVSNYQYKRNFDSGIDSTYIDTHLGANSSIYTRVQGENSYLNTNVSGDGSFLFTSFSDAGIDFIASGDKDKSGSLNYFLVQCSYDGQTDSTTVPLVYITHQTADSEGNMVADSSANQYGFAYDTVRNQLGYVVRDTNGKLKFVDTNYALKEYVDNTFISKSYVDDTFISKSIFNLENGNASYGYPVQMKLLADTFVFTDHNANSGITGNVTAGATGGWAVAIGSRASASGENSYARGNYVIANATLSHAEGEDSVASGPMSHAEGYKTTASGSQSIALGNSTISSGNNSIATGLLTSATNSQAAAFGYNTKATGDTSFAEGNTTVASGNFSHAMGLGTEANFPYMLAVGAYNDPGTDLKVFEVGCGTGPEGKKNALSVYQDGSVRVTNAPSNALDVVRKQDMTLYLHMLTISDPTNHPGTKIYTNLYNYSNTAISTMSDLAKYPHTYQCSGVYKDTDTNNCYPVSKFSIMVVESTMFVVHVWYITDTGEEVGNGSTTYIVSDNVQRI